MVSAVDVAHAFGASAMVKLIVLKIALPATDWAVPQIHGALRVLQLMMTVQVALPAVYVAAREKKKFPVLIATDSAKNIWAQANEIIQALPAMTRPSESYGGSFLIMYLVLVSFINFYT
jgi:hypothetical protein